MSRKNEVLKHFEKHKDYTDERVKSGIELYRKGDVSVTVTLNGKPFEGKVTVRQKNHEFKHGANIFMLGEFEEKEKDKVYREEFAKVFNLATLPFYWNSLEPEEGKLRFAKDSAPFYRRPAIDLCLEYCAEHGIEPKAHCLNYDHFTPAWAHDLPVEEFKKKLDKRMQVLAERYGNVIPSWEVTNETFGTVGRNPTSFFYEDDFVEWSFKTADCYFPLNHLIINDYCIWDMFVDCRGSEPVTSSRAKYYMQIERLIKSGAHLDSIGMQFHNFFAQDKEAMRTAERYNPVHLYNVLDNYAKLGKRIQITEMTIPSYSWQTEDEEIQAEILYNVYRVFFSHPCMEAIIYWNLVDGYGYSKTNEGRGSIGDMTSGENVYYGGLLRFDMTEKPAYKMIDQLFNKEWHTELEAYVNDGELSFRGFYGDYELTFEEKGKTVTKTVSASRDGFNKFSIEL